MSKNSLVYFILWILLQVLIEVNCQMSLKPSVSTKPTSTLIDNKLYILGGRDLNDQFVGKEFFYLDVSVPFNTQQLLWQDLSNIDMVPPHDAATSVRAGANNNTLFLYGGFTSDQTMALVYTFDIQSNTWSIPRLTGINNNIRKYDLIGINYNGKMYLWGGKFYDGSPNFVNDMLILDTINLSWGKGSLVNAPAPRALYGGSNDKTIQWDPKSLNINMGNALTLSEVYIYDTINDNWSTKTTSGKIPSNRGGFSSILGLDGQRIIIFGGYFNNPGYLDTSLYVLDLTNFNWYVPKFSGKIPNPRVHHRANVIKNYMVISFGHGYDNSIESDILLLDISNNSEYIWTTIFDPSVSNNIMSTPSFSSSSPLPSSTSSNITPATMAGAIVGSLVGGIMLSFGSFFLYKRNKNKQNQEIIENDNNHSQEGVETPIESNVHKVEHEIINYNYGQEAVQIPRDANTTDHEPASAIVNRNYNHGQEIIPTSNNERLSLHTFKDEILQAVKQENQNLRSEFLQIIRQEISDITKK
ncbi:hypothetical protein C1645_840758 [Glomus cerebriforme]|uniref:Galactose oxidase n=1 Tax=Glomus cerebriforme TaxID=658196 RepID=A0A397RYV2_9GLOM|nr:hypothetical protein C1645_840758 [Glomus cerebriforme]